MWAGFTDTQRIFAFVPFDFLSTTRQDLQGQPIPAASLAERVQLTDEGQQHILGIQGQLWSENLKGPDQLQYMALPKLIALAERAWAAEPHWTSVDQPEFQQAWSRFATQLGTHELPRLDTMLGGYHYRIPEAGAIIENGVLRANVEYPGLTIRYTADGSQPDTTSSLYREPVEVGPTAQVRVFTTTGRAGHTSTVRQSTP